MARVLAFLGKPRRLLIVSVLLLIVGFGAGYLAWWLSLPRAHATINEDSYQRIKDGMSRKELETLLGGPARSESSKPEFSEWHRMVPQKTWGKGMTPPIFRSPMFIDSDDENATHQADVERARKKGADIFENGHYQLCWHHDLVTITVVFDGTTDVVRGADLWKLSEKRWRDVPPFRWFR